MSRRFVPMGLVLVSGFGLACFAAIGLATREPPEQVASADVLTSPDPARTGAPARAPVIPDTDARLERGTEPIHTPALERAVAAAPEALPRAQEAGADRQAPIFTGVRRRTR